MTASRLQILHAAPGAAWGHVGHTLLTRWVRGMSAPLATRYIQDVARLNREAPRGAVGSALAFIPATTTLPPPDVRAILARAPISDKVIIAGTAIVFEGEGFRASAVRAVVTGVALVSGQSKVFRPFATMHEAIAFLDDRVRRAGAELPPAESLTTAMDALRAAAERATEVE